MVDKTLNRIVSGISLEVKLDKRVVKEVAFHPLLFYKRMIEGGDGRPLRLTYFGSFVPKSGRTSKEKAMKYIADRLLKDFEEAWDALPTDWYREYANSHILKEAIKKAIEEKDKPFLDKVYKYYKEFQKNQ